MDSIRLGGDWIASLPGLLLQWHDSESSFLLINNFVLTTDKPK